MSAYALPSDRQSSHILAYVNFLTLWLLFSTPRFYGHITAISILRLAWLAGMAPVARILYGLAGTAITASLHSSQGLFLVYVCHIHDRLSVLQINIRSMDVGGCIICIAVYIPLCFGRRVHYLYIHCRYSRTCTEFCTEYCTEYCTD